EDASEIAASEIKRQEAVATLSRIGQPAVTYLVDQLSHESSTSRYDAALVLGALGPVASSAVPALIDAIRSKDGLLRIAAADSLRKVSPSHATEAIGVCIDLMKAPTRTGIDNPISYRAVSNCAAGILGDIGGPAVPFLVEALREDDWDDDCYRIYAVETLA